MIEIWKDIEGYEGLYQVSNLGNVKSLNYRCTNIEKNLKQGLRPKGYPFVRLTKNKIEKLYSIHRLVANAFIPNPDNLPCVNHKDENPLNNNVENLEWCTQQYNCLYGTRNKRITETKNKNCSFSCEKPIIQLDKNNNFINEYKSITEASKYTNIELSNIRKCCIKERKSAGGYVWKYKMETIF